MWFMLRMVRMAGRGSRGGAAKPPPRGGGGIPPWVSLGWRVLLLPAFFEWEVWAGCIWVIVCAFALMKLDMAAPNYSDPACKARITPGFERAHGIEPRGGGGLPEMTWGDPADLVVRPYGPVVRGGRGSDGPRDWTPKGGTGGTDSYH